MAQDVALRTSSLPQKVLELQERFELTTQDAKEALTVLEEFRTNAHTLANLLQTGLTVYQVREVFDARDRINVALSSSNTEIAQSISLKQLVLFRHRFPSLPEDGESLAAQVLDLHERFKNSYISHVLDQLNTMADRQPNALPEALADLLAGRLEFGPGDDPEPDEE